MRCGGFTVEFMRGSLGGGARPWIGVGLWWACGGLVMSLARPCGGLLVGCGGLWWAFGGLWWALVGFGGLWWALLSFAELWWALVVFGALVGLSGLGRVGGLW